MAPWLMKLELYITSNVPETKQSLKGCQSGGLWMSMMWFANCQHQKRKKIPQIACCTHFSCHNFYALYVYVKISQGVVFCFAFGLYRILQNVTGRSSDMLCTVFILTDIMEADMTCFLTSMVLLSGLCVLLYSILFKLRG